jgi:hypothetical protein
MTYFVQLSSCKTNMLHAEMFYQQFFAQQFVAQKFVAQHFMLNNFQLNLKHEGLYKVPKVNIGFILFVRKNINN